MQVCLSQNIHTIFPACCLPHSGPELEKAGKIWVEVAQFPFLNPSYKRWDTAGLTSQHRPWHTVGVQQTLNTANENGVQASSCQAMAAGQTNTQTGSIICIILRCSLFFSSPRILSQERKENCNYIFCLGAILFILSNRRDKIRLLMKCL